MRSLFGSVLLATGLAAAAEPAQAVRVPLFGRLPETVLAGPGCGTEATASLALPADAREIRPFEGFAFPDGSRSGGFRVGDPLPGPDGFGDGAVVPNYASVRSFGVVPIADGFTASFTVAPSDAWCSGHFTDPDGSPVPASSVGDPRSRPGFYSGWHTSPQSLMLRFVVDRDRLYTLDTRGTSRASPPRQLAISRRHPLRASGLQWRRWGQQSAFGRGTVRYRGRRLAVAVEFYNAEFMTPHANDGCRVGRVYYQNLAVSVPAWRAKTTYRIGNRCRTMVTNNAAGDLRPPRS